MNPLDKEFMGFSASAQRATQPGPAPAEVELCGTRWHQKGLMKLALLRAPSAMLAAALALVQLAACGSAGTADGPGGPVCGSIKLDGGGGIPDPPKGATLCTAGPCNYQTQEGCATGQSCRPQFPAGSTTVSVGCERAGTLGGGETCTASTECAAGYLCVGDSLDALKCRKMCCGGDWSACDPGESCIRQFQVKFADGHLDHAVDLCYPVGTCDVFDPDSCASEPTRECKIVDPTGAVACSPKSAATQGEPCAPPSVCAQGFTCVGAGARTCRRLCRAEQCGEPSCPVSEGNCVHFDRDPPGVGECTPAD